MANTFKRLGSSRPTTTSNATLYTVPASTTTIAKSIRICNTTNTSVVARVFLVPSGGTADETTAIYWEFDIPPYSTLSDDGSHVLEAAGTIQVRTATASALNFTISGLEITA